MRYALGSSRIDWADTVIEHVTFLECDLLADYQEMGEL
jgi:hypothetical protein